MVRALVRTALLVAFMAFATTGAMAQQVLERADASLKGSLLVYPKIELRWQCQGANCVLVQDTFLSILNDCNRPVDVQLYFINGDPPLNARFLGQPPNQVQLDRAHEGWNWVDCQFTLTPDQPAYISLQTGLPRSTFQPTVGQPMCQPFESLDPGPPQGRLEIPPDDLPFSTRVLRGYVIAWAVDADAQSVNNQIRWNHLSGSAVLVHYPRGTAAEYSAYAFPAPFANDVGDQCGPETGNGLIVGTPGWLKLDGVDYAAPYDKLLFDFYATTAPNPTLALSKANQAVILDTDITLHPVSTDVRQDGDGRVTTKAVFDIWNQNEVRFSGTERCVSCWDQTLVSRYPAPNHMLRANLQTDKGKARINGVGSSVCVSPGLLRPAPLRPILPDPSENASLLGITIKQLTFPPSVLSGATRHGRSALNMVGQGEQPANIRYDLVDTLRTGEETDEAGNVDGGEGVEIGTDSRIEDGE